MAKANSMIIYGSSGCAKTTQGLFFSQYIYEKTGKKTRMVTADGGGYAPIQPAIDAGLIEVVSVSALESPISAIRKLSRGWWPEETPRTKSEAANLEDVGAYFIEGLTSLGDVIMRDLRLKGAKLSQEPGFTFVEDGEKFYGSNMTYFGFVQDTLQEVVHAFSQLPVSRVLWTALEARGETGERQPVYGPEIAGKKSIAKSPAWFGDCIHHESITTAGPKDTSTGAATLKTALRGYFTPHPDPVSQVVYPAKPRVAPEQLPELEKRFPGGFYPLTPTSGIDAFLRVEDELAESSRSGLEEWKRGIDAQRAG